MEQMHNTGQAVKCTFGICRAYSGIPMDMPRARRCPEVYLGKPRGTPLESRPLVLYSGRNNPGLISNSSPPIFGLAPNLGLAGGYGLRSNDATPRWFRLPSPAGPDAKVTPMLPCVAAWMSDPGDASVPNSGGSIPFHASCPLRGHPLAPELSIDSCRAHVGDDTTLPFDCGVRKKLAVVFDDIYILSSTTTSLDAFMLRTGHIRQQSVGHIFLP
jgi:hypothetical protein